MSLMLISTAVGCNGSGPVEIEGTARFQGQPIELGQIMFVSIDEKNAPPASSAITKGAYKITGRGGVQPGKYRVQITVYQPGEQRQDVAIDQIAAPRPIGPRLYAGKNSPLTADVASGNSVFDFEIP